MIVTFNYIHESNRRRRRNRIGIALSVIGVLIIGGYFFYQMRDWVLLPDLIISKPEPGAVVTGPEVVVVGIVTPGVRLTVNGEEAYSERTGVFTIELLLPEGVHTIVIAAENKFGRKRVEERQIVVEN